MYNMLNATNRKFRDLKPKPKNPWVFALGSFLRFLRYSSPVMEICYNFGECNGELWGGHASKYISRSLTPIFCTWRSCADHTDRPCPTFTKSAVWYDADQNILKMSTYHRTVLPRVYGSFPSQKVDTCNIPPRSWCLTSLDSPQP